MQTFLPYADFLESAKVLDHYDEGTYSRVWKQVVEAKQVMLTLCRMAGITEGLPTKWGKIFGDMEGFPFIDQRKDWNWKQLQKVSKFITNPDQGEYIINGSYQNIDGGWVNHPALKMWVGHEHLMMHYFNVFLQYCYRDLGVATNLHYVSCKFSEGDPTDQFLIYKAEITEEDKPWWLGNEDFHRAMRARLIEKSKEKGNDYYLQKFPEDEGFNDGMYLWPLMDGSNTFYSI